MVQRFKRQRNIRGLEQWRLEKFCEKHDIDKHHVDNKLTGDENKEHLKSIWVKTPEDLVDCAELFDPRVEEVVMKLVEKCKNVIMRERAIRVHVRAKERQSLKQEKFELGKLILQEREYLHIRYGDNYFGKLAKRINEPGYSTDQLYKCVKFAEHPNAEILLKDDSLSWEKIRIEELREKLLGTIKSAKECLLITLEEEFLEDVRSTCKSQNEESYSSCGSRKLCLRLLRTIRKKRKELERERQVTLLAFSTSEGSS